MWITENQPHNCNTNLVSLTSELIKKYKMTFALILRMKNVVDILVMCNVA